jgi:predicted nuclease of predicted toxin-antitoxin system
MPKTIRFHLDENCDPRIATALRRWGIDLTTTPEAGLLEAEDEQHVSFAMSEGRVIFTRDADFLRIAASGQKHPGIVYCHPTCHSLGEIIRRLTLIWEIYEPEEMRNRVEYL